MNSNFMSQFDGTHSFPHVWKYFVKNFTIFNNYFPLFSRLRIKNLSSSFCNADIFFRRQPIDLFLSQFYSLLILLLFIRHFLFRTSFSILICCLMDAKWNVFVASECFIQQRPSLTESLHQQKDVANIAVWGFFSRPSCSSRAIFSSVGENNE